mgnify:FL=1
MLAALLAAAPAPAVCVPPEVPAYREWTLAYVGPVVLLDREARPVLGLDARYRTDGQRLRAFWLGGVLAVVDPAPDDAAVAPWYDPAAVEVRPGGPPTAADAPRQSCRWRRAQAGGDSPTTLRDP